MFEVERSVRVLDGAVAIFDAVAGVQAQSETVWQQARRYSVPVVAYLNKMDRDGASFDGTISMIKQRLGAYPIPVQMPFHENERFEGVIDLLTMELIRWQDHDGSCLTRVPLSSEDLETRLPQAGLLANGRTSELHTILTGRCIDISCCNREGTDDRTHRRSG